MGIAHPAYDPQGVCSMQRIDVCWHRDVLLRPSQLGTTIRQEPVAAVRPKGFGVNGCMLTISAGWALVSRETWFHVKRAYEWRCAVRAGNIAVRLRVVSA